MLKTVFAIATLALSLACTQGDNNDDGQDKETLAGAVTTDPNWIVLGGDPEVEELGSGLESRAQELYINGYSAGLSRYSGTLAAGGRRVLVFSGVQANAALMSLTGDCDIRIEDAAGRLITGSALGRGLDAAGAHMRTGTNTTFRVVFVGYTRCTYEAAVNYARTN